MSLPGVSETFDHIEYDDSDQEMELEDENQVGPEGPGVGQSNEENEETKWKKLELDQKCKDVMGLLAGKKRRWDDGTDDPTIPVLEHWKKAGLKSRDLKDKNLPTVLHILAKHYLKEYAVFPERVRETVIKHLLMENDSPVGRSSRRDSRDQPILHDAIRFSNDDFVRCVQKCSPARFPDLLHARDIDGKNCLHHIFDINERCKSTNINTAKKVALQRAQWLIPIAWTETLAAKDNMGNTPLHYALEYRQCYGRAPDYVKLVQEFILRSDPEMKRSGSLNNEDESPIQYSLRTEKEYRAREEYKARHRARKHQAHQPSGEMEPRGVVKEVKTDWAHGKEKHPSRDRNKREVLNSQIAQERIAPPTLECSFKNSGKPNGTAESDETEVRPTVLRRESVNLIGESKLEAISTNRTSHQARGLVATTKGAYLAEKETRTSAMKGPNQGAKIAKSPDVGDKPWRDILEFLRLHYIRTRADLEARDLIDGKDAPDRTLYFDASGHGKISSIIELITRISVGGFGSTLAYVYLPTVEHTVARASADDPVKIYHQSNQRSPRQKPKEDNPNMGRTSLVEVFRALHQVGVRRVLRLHVDDMAALSHTDEAIEESLQGCHRYSDIQKAEPIAVETWDWRKADMSTDVISYAAPDAEEVNLYWSGNPMILLAWSSSDGIPRLYLERKKLKKIIVHAAPGLEKYDRMDKALSRFQRDTKRSMSEDGKGNVQIEVLLRKKGLWTRLENNGGVNQAPDGKAESEKQHSWVTEMEAFTHALYEVHKVLGDMSAEKPERVKVCLIDDGVDLDRLLRFRDVPLLVTGRSFYPRDGLSERPFHRSSGGHGTILAHMILRINPWASLQVMKLKDMPSEHGRTIFAETAAKSIREAVRRDVDIISMSWTIKHKPTTSYADPARTGKDSNEGQGTQLMDPIQMLENDVETAVQRGKSLMFCSASDDISSAGTDALPYKKGVGYIFRIGAALRDGQPDGQIEDKPHIDYFFPGNQVAEAKNPRDSRPFKFHDGSSVSTALAAGLASLILYCAIVVRTYWKAQSNEAKVGDFENYVQLLKQRNKMKKAFDNVQSKTWKANKFLPVWDMFGKATFDIKAAEGAKKVEILSQLVSDLCSKINMP